MATSGLRLITEGQSDIILKTERLKNSDTTKRIHTASVTTVSLVSLRIVNNIYGLDLKMAVSADTMIPPKVLPASQLNMDYPATLFILFWKMTIITSG